MLYFRLTDSSGQIYKVFPIGPILSFGKTEPQVDQFSNLHVLYQDGARSFNYTVINPSGEILRRETYEYTTRPRLVRDTDGFLNVAGGKRRVTSKDVPPAYVTKSLEAPPTAKP
jgi:hypothetical protein